MLPFQHQTDGLEKLLKSNLGIRFNPRYVFIVGAVFLYTAYVAMPDNVIWAIRAVFFVAPVWLPLLIIGGYRKIGLILKQSTFIDAQKYVVLEIKPPRNIVKTPLAMEAFLSSMYITGGEGTWHARWLGKMRPWFSLEMASFEGQIHFYIWTQSKFRRMIESQLYAQYPGIQIIESLDYTRTISADPSEYVIWGCDYKLAADDPLPIKTYVEYGLDKVQKEVEQVDPLSNVIEFLASAGKGEYVWLQFIFRAHKGEKYHMGDKYSWKDKAKEMIEKIRMDTRSSYVDPTTGKEMPGFPNPTKGQMETMAAIERNVSKIAFDVGGRCIYLSKPDKFNVAMITHIIGLFKPFYSEGWNGIKASGWMMHFDDYPWEIGVEKLKDHYRHDMVQAFRRRQYFFEPIKHGLSPDDAMVMSTEELATIYHIPSLATESPSFQRVQSATGEAPVNLPV